MSGLYTRSGVPFGDALHTVDVDTINCVEGELFYATSNCAPRFDPRQANAVTSELLNLATVFAGDTYDCSRLDNLAGNLGGRLLISHSFNVTATDVQLVSTMADASEVTVNMPLDLSSDDLSAFDLNGYGLSAGQWNKPLDRAATVAELALSSASAVSVTPAMLANVLTNRAVEDGAGARGPMNANGRLGFMSQFFGTDTTIADALESNGAVKYVEVLDGVTTIVPPGEYQGQRLYLHFIDGGDGEFAESFMSGTFQGTLRAVVDHAIQTINTPAGTAQSVIVRQDEIWEMVWIASGHWRVASNFRQFAGNNFQEHHDGTATIWAVGSNFPVGAPGFVNQVVPVAMANGNYLVTATLQAGSAAAAGQITGPVIIDSTSQGPTGFRAFNATGNPNTSWHYKLDRVVLDYAAL